MTLAAMKAVSEAMPDYPGRAALEQGLAVVLEPLTKRYAGHQVQRLLGFWLCWHAYGGTVDGMLAAGHWSRGNVYAQRKEFHAVFGVEVEEFLPVLAAAVQAPSDGADVADVTQLHA